MYLSKIELHGFKSFAQKTILTFSRDSLEHKGITAIVGPNGSGKSNISDAIRWVLGEQSIKLLRGKKSEDVIFAGSAKKSRMGMAEVVLTINNDDNTFPLDYSEIVFGRRLYRDGTSDYMLNGNKIRLIDLQLLLAKAGIGGRSYAVIGQGMIDHFLIASPIERKVFFDEAAGVKEFEMKRKQAENKLNASRENLEHAQTVIEELAPRVRYLSRAVKRLEEREQVESELKETQRLYYGKLWTEIESSLSRVREKESGINERLKKAKTSRDLLTKKLSALEQSSTVSEELLQLQKKYEEIRRARDDVYEQLTKKQTQIEILRVRTSAVYGSKQVSMSEISDVFNELINKFNALFDLCEKCKDIKQLIELKDKLKEYGAKLEIISKKYNVKTVPQKTDEIVNLEKETQSLKEKIKNSESGLQNIKEQMTRVSSEEKQKKSEFFDVQRELQNSVSSMHAIEREFNEYEIERARLDTKRDSLESEMRYELNDRIEEIKHVSQDDVKNAIPSELQPSLFRLKHRLEMIGGIDPETMNEHEEVKKRYDFLIEQVDDLLRAIESLEFGIEELNTEMKRRRTETLSKINEEFDKYFRNLFLGGKASLMPIYAKEILEREEEDLENNEDARGKISVKSKEKELVGIDIQAQPPGKRIKDISVLSGGERAMTSVALICAILTVSPSPFVILDEVDAALDESNSIRFAEILEKLSEKTQFVVVTHNRASMQKSRVLYGVTMGDDGISQLLSVELEKAQAWAK